MGGWGDPKARQTVKEGNNDLIRLSSITGWGVALGGAEGVYSALSTCYYLFHKSCDFKKGGGETLDKKFLYEIIILKRLLLENVTTLLCDLLDKSICYKIYT